MSTMTVLLKPAEAEALLWAAAAASGPVHFPPELTENLGRAEAHLLLALARAAAAEPVPAGDERVLLRRCVRCGRPGPACRCRQRALPAPLDPGSPTATPVQRDEPPVPEP